MISSRRRLGVTIFVLLALVAVACGGDDEAGATSTTTTTGNGATGGEASFALTQVGFGDAAFVEITNVGDVSADIGGFFLCQRPNYFELPSIELAPGEKVQVAASGGGLTPGGQVIEVVTAEGRLGEFDPTAGEMGLYSSGSFGSSDAIVAYVEWGSGGQGRESVAVGAGLWAEGAFVETDTSTQLLVADDLVTSPDGWTVATS